MSGRRPRAQQRRRLDFVPWPGEPSAPALERRLVLSAAPLVSGLIATTTTITSLQNPAPFGGPPPFKVTVASDPGTATPTGTVDLYAGSYLFTSGTLSSDGTFTTGYYTSIPFEPGDHVITADYGGDATHAPSTSAPLTETVGPVDFPLILEESLAPGVGGEQVTLTASFPQVAQIPESASFPPITGTVTFHNGTTVLGTVPAALYKPLTLTTSLPFPGNYQFRATYAGDANYDPSTATPQKIATEISLTAPSPGETLFQAAILTPSDPGLLQNSIAHVDFYDGKTFLASRPIDQGTASISLPALGAGNHAITAYYSGGDHATTAYFISDDSFLPSSATVTVQGTVTTLFESTVGGPLLEAVVGTPDGTDPGVTEIGNGKQTIAFYDGATLLATVPAQDGVASIPFPALLPGKHTLTADFSGGDGFAPSQGTLTLTAPVLATTLSVSAPTTAGAFGPLTVSATLSAPSPAGAAIAPTGSVAFFDGSTPLATVPLSGGKASYTGSAPAIGHHAITAQYVGDALFAPARSAAAPVAVGDANARYLNAVYLDLLGRPIDPVGLAGWEGALNGGASRASVAMAIEASRESALTTLANLSRSLAGAAPTAAEQSAALRLQARGQADALSLEAIVLDSPGFAQARGGTNAGFVAAVGRALTGGALPTSQASRLMALASAGNRGGVVATLLGDPATFANLVSGDYQAYLGRAGSASEIAYYVAQLRAGASPGRIAAQFLASPEFFKDAT